MENHNLIYNLNDLDNLKLIDGKEYIIIANQIFNQTININIHNGYLIKLFIYFQNNLDLNLNFKILNNSKLFLYCICNNSNDFIKNININILQNLNSTSITKIFGILKDNSSTNIYLENKILKNMHMCKIDQDIFLHLNNKVKLSKAIPKLNIANNQVKSAKHSCIVGDIFSKKLLYFKTKGISIDAAKKIILNGYLNNIINNFSKISKIEIKKILKL